MSSAGQRNISDAPEADLLAREAAAAQAAALGAIADLKAGLATAADPRLWAQQHPWAAVGIAAAAGFAAAALVVPTPAQKLSDRVSDLLRGIQPSAGDNGEAAEGPPPGAGPLAGVMEALVDLGKTAITNFVMATVHKTSEAPHQADGSQSETGRIPDEAGTVS
jgi:hypothetical protein